MRYTLVIFSILFSSLFTPNALFGQNGGNPREQAIAAADTSNFRSNQQGQWQLYNSYLQSRGSDSVHIELVIGHETYLNWGVDNLCGEIKNPLFFPTATRTISIILGDVQFLLSIHPNGKCYMRRLGGTGSNTDVIVPVNGEFKL